MTAQLSAGLHAGSISRHDRKMRQVGVGAVQVHFYDVRPRELASWVNQMASYERVCSQRLYCEVGNVTASRHARPQGE